MHTESTNTICACFQLLIKTTNSAIRKSQLIALMTIMLLAFIPVMIVLIPLGWFSTTPVGSTLGEVFNYITSFGLGIIIVGFIWLVFIILEAIAMLFLIGWIDESKHHTLIKVAVGVVGTGILPFFTWQWILPYDLCAPTACAEWALCMIIMLILIIHQRKHPEDMSAVSRKHREKTDHVHASSQTEQTASDMVGSLSTPRTSTEHIQPKQDSEEPKPHPLPASSISKDNGLQISDFSLGDKITHDQYGIGIVVDIQDKGRNSILTVDFDSVGVKRLMLRIAPIKRL